MFFGLKWSTQRRPIVCFANVLSIPPCSSVYYIKRQTSVALHLASATSVSIDVPLIDSQAAKSLACLPARLCLPDSWAWLQHNGQSSIQMAFEKQKETSKSGRHAEVSQSNRYTLNLKNPKFPTRLSTMSKNNKNSVSLSSPACGGGAPNAPWQLDNQPMWIPRLC